MASLAIVLTGVAHVIGRVGDPSGGAVYSTGVFVEVEEITHTTGCASVGGPDARKTSRCTSVTRVVCLVVELSIRTCRDAGLPLELV